MKFLKKKLTCDLNRRVYVLFYVPSLERLLARVMWSNNKNTVNLYRQEVCKSMRDHTEDDETLLMSVFNGLSVYFNYTGSAKCLNLSSAFSDDVMNG